VKFHITNHAVRRYHQRVHPAKPMPTDPAEAQDAFRQTKAILLGEVDTSVEIPCAATAHTLRKLADGSGVLLCRERSGWTYVVTVLGPGETIDAADEETLEAISRAACGKLTGVAEAAINNLGKHGRVEAILDPKGAAAKMAERVVSAKAGAIIDGLIAARVNVTKAEAKPKRTHSHTWPMCVHCGQSNAPL